MVGRDRALSLLERALSYSDGDQTQVLLMGGDSYLTRFSRNYIHQNVGERSTTLLVKVVRGKKTGTTGTTSLDEDSIRAAVKKASQTAAVQPDNPHFSSLPSPGSLTAVEGFSSETAAFSPDERAKGVKALVDRAAVDGCEAAGAFSTATQELAVCSSLGASAYQLGSQASLKTVVMSGSGAGYGARVSRRVSDIDPGQVAAVAVEKCLASRGAVSIDPGEYTVILEPEAAAEMVNYLVRLGFSAMAVQENRSFLCGQMGEMVVGPNVTIWDDGSDLAGLPLSFDFEGVPKKKLMLVENGRAANLVYDSYTAGREVGKQSTGHAIPYTAYSPMALNLFMAPGESSLDDMIASTERGILVTRFHYTNPVHPVKALITGMTRDGTFLIENGRITGAVKNLRFTESVLRALSEVEMVGAHPSVISWFFGGTVVPPLKIRKFNFTGATEH